MTRARLLPFAVFLILVVLSEVSVRTHPILLGEFFTGERSCNLWIADELNNGKTLYRDVFSNYGALPAYLHAWLAAWFGNSPETFLRMQQVEILLIALMSWILLRRHLTLESSALFLLAFLLPSLFFTGGRTAHVELERMMILAVALAWRPAATTTYRSLVLAGILMGVMQLAKFGGGIVAMAAWVLAEACLREVPWSELIRRWIALAFGYAGFTFLWALFLFYWLPRQNALDVLWPFFMTANYAVYVDPGTRWPHWVGVKEFLALQIGPLIALALVVGMTVLALFQPKKSKPPINQDGSGVYLFLGLFFLVACLIYLKNIWLFYEFDWIPILACAWAWNRLPSLPRWSITAIFVLVTSINLHRMLKPVSPDLNQVVDMPTGDKLMGTKREVDRVLGVKAAVDKLIAANPQRNAVFIVGVGSGWHHFMGWPAANRQSVWILEGFVRPYDNAAIIDSLGKTAAVVVDEDLPSTDPRTWEFRTTSHNIPFPTGLPKEVCEALAQRLGKPIIIDDTCWVYPVLPDSGQGLPSGK